MKRPHLVVDDSKITEALIKQIAESIDLSDGARQQSLKEKLLTWLDLARTVTTLDASGSKTFRELAFDRIVRAASELEDKLASPPPNQKTVTKAVASLVAALGPEFEKTPQGTEQHPVRAILQWHYVAAGSQYPRSAANHTPEEKQFFAQAIELIKSITSEKLQDKQNAECHEIRAIVARIKNAANIARAQAKAEEKAPHPHKPNYARRAIVRQVLDDYRELTGNPIGFGTTTDGTHFCGPLASFFSLVMPLFGYSMTPSAIRSMVQDLPPED
jgi:hypothetical protein